MSGAWYDVVPCPACRGTGERPNQERCGRCEGFGGLEQCRAERPGQREAHDLAECSHYMDVGQPL